MNKNTANAVSAICITIVSAAVCFGIAVLAAKEIFWMLIRLDVIGK